MITASGAKGSTIPDFTSSIRSSEPPSLLGHLGTECANAFVQVLTKLDSPNHDLQLETSIWKFISAVVSNKQQGLSILLLRGETLLGRSEDKSGKSNPDPKNGAKKPTSILTIALDELSSYNMIDQQPERALAMLETVSLSQNYWSLAMEDMGHHTKFLSTFVQYIESFNVEFNPSDSKEVLTTKSNKVAVVAFIAQILAMHMHTKRSSSSRHEPGFISRLLNPKTLDYYFKNGVQITNYRASLHDHLEKNVRDKWPGLHLAMLVRTKLNERKYGPGFSYDLGLAGKLLGFDKSWESNGTEKSRANSASKKCNGYKEEVEQANINLSIIDSQVVR